MTKLFLYVLILFSATAQAQSYDKWEIYQNRKEVSSFNNKKETSDERRVLLLNRFLEGPGFFVIEFQPAAEQAYNNTLFLQIHNSEIAGIMEGRQKVRVYSWAVPKDPALAATVRVRRLLLCTLYTR